MATTFPLLQLGQQLQDLGATEVLVKQLAPNDNSKNQIYVGQDISELGLLPLGEITHNPGSSQKRSHDPHAPIFRAAVNLWWLTDSGLAPAPSAKLIVYPQYASYGEVRLSGFLASCRNAPSELLDPTKRGREPGRVLVLAPLRDGRVIASLFVGDSAEAKALRAVQGEPYGALQRYNLQWMSAPESSEMTLRRELRRIHELGWLDPVYLEPDGSFSPCAGTNCGGATLESHLGIRANGLALPDFQGWEIKQYAVANWGRPAKCPITLMTPEPNGGAYKEHGLDYFIRTWGYPDQKGRSDRINFGGDYRITKPAHPRTKLRLILCGYDEPTGNFQGDGFVGLIDERERVAASWSFAKLMDHWKHKHAKAAYLPSIRRAAPTVQYSYGARAMLAEEGRFRFLLRAFAYGVVFYDPGIKMENASSGSPVTKRRSQFRIKSADLGTLYERHRTVDLT